MQLLEPNKREETQENSFSTSRFGLEMQALDVTEEKCPKEQSVQMPPQSPE